MPTDTHGFTPRGNYIYTAGEQFDDIGNAYQQRAIVHIWECVWCGDAVINTLVHDATCAPRVAARTGGGKRVRPTMPSELQKLSDDLAEIHATLRVQIGSATHGQLKFQEHCRACGVPPPCKVMRLVNAFREGRLVEANPE